MVASSDFPSPTSVAFRYYIKLLIQSERVAYRKLVRQSFHGMDKSRPKTVQFSPRVPP